MIGEKINVNGIAIQPGISKNGIMYTAEELSNFAPTLKGKPILKDHKSATDNTIGLVENTTFENGKVNYEGWIKEDGSGILERIGDGRIKEVSIGAFVKQLVKENDDDEHYIAVGMEGMELSTTPTPGVNGTSLNQAIENANLRRTDKNLAPVALCESITGKLPNKKIETHHIVEKNIKEDKKMADVDKDALKEELRREIIAEDKKRAEEQAKLEEEARRKVKEELEAEQKEKEEQEKKEEEAKEALRKELKEELEPQLREEIQEEMKSKTKGKVGESEKQAEVAQTYQVEQCEFGAGYSLYKMPNADGSYR